MQGQNSTIGGLKRSNISHEEDYIILNYADTVSLSYEGCPVGTGYVGLIGTIDGKLVYIPTLPEDTRNADGSPKKYEVTCYIIDDELATVIKKYVN